MKTSYVHAIVAGFILLAVVAVGAQSISSRSAAEQRNLDRALDFWRNFWTPIDLERVEQYVAEDYIEHFPGLKGGGRKELIENYLRPRKAKMPNGQPLVEPFLTVVDGDITMLFLPRTDAAGRPTIRIEIQRWNDGKQAEHWDGQSIYAPTTAPKLAARTAAEQRNLDLVLKFWRGVLTPLKTEQFGDYVAANYIEHDAMVPTGGLKGFVEFENRAKARFPNGYPPATFVHTLVDGDLVALTRVKNAPAALDGTPSSDKILGVDLLRVRDGKIVEHWGDLRRLSAPGSAGGARN